MELEFEFEEKEEFTLEEVQALISDFKGQAIQTIESKDLELENLATEVEKVKELQEGNHLLQIKNLAISNNIDEDLYDLIQDDDIEVVKGKIEKIKAITKEKEIDNSFKPTTKREDDSYTKAIDNKDAEGALKSKFSKLFGN